MNIGQIQHFGQNEFQILQGRGGGTVNGAFSFPKRGFQASSDVNDNSCGESVFEPPLSSGDLAKKKKKKYKLPFGKWSDIVLQPMASSC